MIPTTIIRGKVAPRSLNSPMVGKQNFVVEWGPPSRGDRHCASASRLVTVLLLVARSHPNEVLAFQEFRERNHHENLAVLNYRQRPIASILKFKINDLLFGKLLIKLSAPCKAAQIQIEELASWLRKEIALVSKV